MTICLVDAQHGELPVREFIHPKWRGLVSAVYCPICGRAWLRVRGTYAELDLHKWTEVTHVGL